VRPGTPAADTASLRARWPDVLEAVQGRRRVAWMQLSDASVLSLDDGVLTLAFARAGTAKAFLAGGYDQVLAQVLAEMFGVTPRITTSVGAGGAETGSRAAGPGGPQDSDRPLAQPPDRNGTTDTGARDDASAATAERQPRQPGATTGAARQAGGTRKPTRQADVPRRPATASSAPTAARDEPRPYDRADSDTLTGSSLIERELGGQIIRELDE
jgi:DNA polymerase-3 subunit gamma/tau